MLQAQPELRFSAEDVLDHPWLAVIVTGIQNCYCTSQVRKITLPHPHGLKSLSHSLTVIEDKFIGWFSTTRHVRYRIYYFGHDFFNSHQFHLLRHYTGKEFSGFMSLTFGILTISFVNGIVLSFEFI